MSALAGGGERRAALRQFERLERALRTELGVAPSAAALALRDELLADQQSAPDRSAPARVELVGRDAEVQRVRRLLAAVRQGRGPRCCSSRAGRDRQDQPARLLSRTPPRAGTCGSGTGVAARIDGAWPYAPVLEGLADLCRRHPALLDGLDDAFREEIERALSGRDSRWDGQGTHQRLFVAAAELLRLAAAGVRRGAGGGRRARGGRGEPAAAALPGPQHADRAGAARAGAPPRSPPGCSHEVRGSLLGRGAARHARPGPARPRGRRGARPPVRAAGRRRRPSTACTPRPGACRSPWWRWPGPPGPAPPRRGRRRCRRRCGTPWPLSPCWARPSTPTSSPSWSEATEEAAYALLDQAPRAGGAAADRRGVRVPPPAVCGHRCSRRAATAGGGRRTAGPPPPCSGWTAPRPGSRTTSFRPGTGGRRCPGCSGRRRRRRRSGRTGTRWRRWSRSGTTSRAATWRGCWSCARTCSARAGTRGRPSAYREALGADDRPGGAGQAAHRDGAGRDDGR